MNGAAVLFDLDGVLIDSFEVWRLLLNCALEGRGKPPLTEAEFNAVWGQGMEADIRMYFPDMTVSALQAFYEAHFGRFLQTLKVFPDTRDVVETLSSRGFKMAIASNSAPGIIAESLEAAGLKRFFPVAVGAGGRLRGKPEPDTLLLAMKSIGARPSETVIVVDSPYDMEAGRSAGVLTVGLGLDGGAWRIERLRELLELPPFNHGKKCKTGETS